MRFFGNRFENGTTVFELDAGSAPITTQPAVPGYAFGNYFVSNAGTYLSNSQSLRFNSIDLGITPDGRVHLENDGVPLFVKNIKASTDAAQFRAQTTGYGIALLGASDAEKSAWRTKSGSGATITGIESIAKGATSGHNLRGTATFATAATVAVTFGTAEPDANYYLVITGDTGETYSWSSKATTGFTITSSNGSSTAVVDWVLIR